jgi:hypothetical protein
VLLPWRNVGAYYRAGVAMMRAPLTAEEQQHCADVAAISPAIQSDQCTADDIGNVIATGQIDPLTALIVRADARAFLWSVGEYTKHEAVDLLQRDAERDGLIALHGQDAIQQILARAFERYAEVSL